MVGNVVISPPLLVVPGLWFNELLRLRLLGCVRWFGCSISEAQLSLETVNLKDFQSAQRDELGLSVK